MDTEKNNKIDFKDKVINFYNGNKFKIYILLIIMIMTSISVVFLQVKFEKKNEKIAENYVRAGILLNLGKKEDSLNIYEEIIASKNKFYSVLALNSIIEKNLIVDEERIIRYFEIVEEGDYVLCAISGKEINLQNLNYWNVDLQEAYFSPIEVNERYKNEKK